MDSILAEFPIDRLSMGDRLELMERIWESILDSDEPLPIPAWHLDEIHRRIKSTESTPKQTITLEELRAKLLEPTE